MASSEVVIFIGNSKDDDLMQIKCPDCYFTRSVPLRKLKEFKRAIKVKCKCGINFEVRLEYRRRLRKDTKLSGFYCPLSMVEGGGWESCISESSRFNCTISDLSVEGAAVVTREGHTVQVGDRLRLRFELDRGVSPRVELDVVVRNTKSNMFGCEFIDKEKYNKKIGFYLL